MAEVYVVYLLVDIFLSYDFAYSENTTYASKEDILNIVSY